MVRVVRKTGSWWHYGLSRDYLFFEQGEDVYKLSLDGKPLTPSGGLMRKTNWPSITDVIQELVYRQSLYFTPEKIEKEHLEILTRELL